MQAEQRRETPSPERFENPSERGGTPGRKTEVVVEPAQAAEAPPKNARRPFAVLLAVVLVSALGVGGYLWLTAGEESTDDAQVAADLVPVGARVAGQVVEVSIHENQLVKKGDLIAKIDEADFVAKVKQAEAGLASEKAQAAQADAQVAIITASSKGSLSSAKAAYSGSSVGVASADAELAAAEARIVRSEADVRKAQTDLTRARELRTANAVPQERLDDAQAAFDSAQAALTQVRAEVTAAKESRRAAMARVSEAAGRVAQNAPVDAQIAAARANAELAHARVASAEAALLLQQNQLAYTSIRAPADGVASKLSVHPGQLVGVGQAVVEIVPTTTYVIANFKETQVGRMRPGERATIEIDAYPHRKFEGRVESISGGTGASFSLLPADNASGNFVKVVQRVPVRIAWVNLPTDVSLRAGLSVNAIVEVAP